MSKLIEVLITSAATVLIAIISSSGVWAFLQKKYDTRDANRRMLLGISHDRLRYLSLQYINRGSITTDEFENLYKYLWVPYKELGGNGMISKLIREVEALPIKD